VRWSVAHAAQIHRSGEKGRERCELSNERKELSFDAVFLTYTFAVVTFLRIEVT
jgi:hypothetical protein